MTTQHTPGRLIITSKYTLCTDDGETPVASTCLIDSVSENDGANARRLVACWNACEGISTTEIEAAARSGSISHALERVICQRDELLALLSEVSQNFTRDDDLPNGLLTRIDAAIAKVEGKS